MISKQLLNAYLENNRLICIKNVYSLTDKEWSDLNTEANRFCITPLEFIRRALNNYQRPWHQRLLRGGVQP